MAAAAYIMNQPRLYASAQRAAKMARIVGRRGRGLPPPLTGWTAGRDLPEFPKQTFRDWWAARPPGAGTTPAASSPAWSSSAGSSPAGSSSAGSSAVGTSSAGSSPAGSSPVEEER